MRKICLLFTALCSSAILFAQSSTANYVFTTASNGSLADMSSGTTTLLAGNIDDTPSPLTNIGFDFFFQGIRYSQFSINDNGVLRLGAAAQTNTPYKPLGQPGVPIITAYGADQRTHTGDGKVHYKVIGAAPNRILIVEWLNNQANFNSGGTADLTYQVQLNESTGVIKFVYGSMTMSALGAGSTDSRDPHIGFSSSNVANTIGSVTAAQNGAPPPSYNGSAVSPVANLYTAGAITVLTSAAQGARRVFTFTPPAPTAATGLNFTAVTLAGMTLNWTDSPDEKGYAIYRSTDGINYVYDGPAALNAISYVASSLTPGVTYFWRVYAVSEGAFSTPLSGSQATTPPANITSNGTGGGNWSAPATWTGGVVPGAFDNATIQNGDVVTIDVAGSALNLTVGQGVSGILQFEQATARILTTTNTTIAAGGIFRSNPAGTQTTHLLVVNGNLTNNGTIDFSTNANLAAAGIAFGSTVDGTAIFGAGSATDLSLNGGISIAKGTNATPVLNFIPGGVITVQGAATAGFLTMLNGTFKLAGTSAFNQPLFNNASYTIPNGSGFWMDNPNATAAGQNGSPTVSGLLRMSQGTLNVGTIAGNTMGFAAGSTIIIEGGAINVAGAFGVALATNAVNYTQSGGTITVCTIGNASSTFASFDLGTAAGTIVNINGGAIIVQLANTSGAGPRDYRNQAGNLGTVATTGGTVQMGNASSGAAKSFNIAGVLPELVLNNTSAGHTTNFLTPAVFNNITRNITVNTGTTLNVGNFVFLFNGTNLVNNGTITANGGSTNFVWFTTTSPVSYTGTGIFTSPVTNFAIQSDMGLTLDPASPNIPVSNIRLFTGSVFNSNKITLGTGGATASVVQIGNTTTATNAGNFDMPFVFNLGTGGQSMSYLRTTTVSRTTGPEINPARALSTLTVDDNDATHTLVLGGGNLSVSTGATPTLNLTNGKVDLNGNVLTLGLNGTTAAFAGALGTNVGYVYNGSFKRWISPTTGNRDFPMGVAAFKRNASINFTGAPTGGGSLTAQWISSPGGTNGLPLLEGAINVSQTTASGYWTITAGDALGGGTYTGTFTGTGIAGVTDVTQLVLLKRVNAASLWTLNGTHVTGTGTPAAPVVSRTGMSGFSDFTIGSSNLNTLPVGLLTFSGYKDGSHNTLKWRTANEINSLGFEIQRSNDGSSYASIGFVNSMAPGGTSTGDLSYLFNDNSPVGAKQYYRLRQVDINGGSKLSNIVLINGSKPTTLAIGGLFPNPANAELNVLIDAPAADKITLLVTDLSGRAIVTRTAGVETGSNTLKLDVSRLSAGQYFIKLVCSTYCESPAVKFLKQ